jgi:hypothetical protein
MLPVQAGSCGLNALEVLTNPLTVTKAALANKIELNDVQMTFPYSVAICIAVERPISNF